MNRRTSLVILDQAISSLSNFMLVLVVGRVLGPHGFGVFALCLGGWFILIGVSRALVFDPMIVTGEHVYGLPAHVSASLLVAAPAALVVFAAGLVVGLGGTAGAALCSLAVFLPALVLQEFWRRVGFMREKPGSSVINDLAFFVVQIAALAVCWRVTELSPALSVACWGVGAIFAAVLGFWQFRTRVGSFREGVECLRAGAPIGGWLAMDFATKYGLRQGYVYIVAAVAGVQVVGALQAAQNLTGPTNVLYFGANAAALAEGAARYREGGYPAMARVTRTHAIAVAAVVSMYCVLLGAAGEGLLGNVYGKSYGKFSILIPFAAAQAFVFAFDLLPSTRLRLLRRTRRLFFARAAAVPLALTLAFILPRELGLQGVGLSAAAVAVCSSSAAWLVLISDWHVRRRESASPALSAQ